MLIPQSFAYALLALQPESGYIMTAKMQ